MNLIRTSVLLWLLLIFGAFAGSNVFGQSVQQSGTVTPNTAAVWNSTGVIKGGVTATDSPLTSFGVTRDAVDAFCVSSARSTAVGRNQLCFQAATSGNAKISLQNYGTATAQGLDFVINGVTVSIPSTGGQQVALENGPFGTNSAACFISSAGVLRDCGITIASGIITAGTWQGTPIALGFGGTGATSASTARTSLGLGTIATQNSSAVAITGGAITGMSAPTIGSDVATKTYVDSTSSGLNILAQSTLATAAATVLPNSPTYSNGASGVGATLTAGSNTTLTVDGTAAPLNTVVLVKSQASAFQNGIYTVTTAGSGAAAWVLTRATYFDQAAEMKAGSYTFITSGATNINTAYTLQTAVTTVGTDSLTFVQFSAASGGTVTSATIAGGTGISVSGTCTITSSGTCTVNNTGVTSVATDGTSGLTGGTITTTGTVACSQGSSTQFGCVKADGTSLLASSGILSVNTSQLTGVVPTTSTVTITIASPGVVTWTAHNLALATPVYFCTTVTLPTGLSPCVPAVGVTYSNAYVSNPTLYYVIPVDADHFRVATSVANANAGTAVNTSGSQSGTHTAFANAFACAGCVGELIFHATTTSNSNVGSGVDTIFNTITLTPGIWKISGNAGALGTSGSTVFSTTHSTYGIGATTISTVPYNGPVAAHVTSNQSNGWIWPFTETTVQVYSTGSLNAVCQPIFTGGTATCYGYLQAVRDR